ncbi:Crp/Fnr family transcriptional regulator [Paenibacillus taihuensis]|uniref:Crp/Fnr family transcriptional regulator n=1 Tax=Paenibacillus taihuensis TaxID=1156355 RepID=UPI003CCC81BB
MSLANGQHVGTPNTACFSAVQLSRLKNVMQECKLSAGSFIYREGDPADKLYFLVHGSVRITKATDDGRQLTIYLHQQGDLFGQVDPFHESAHSFGAEVIEDAVVGMIPRKALEAQLSQHGEFAVEFMKWMGLMHRMTQTRMRDLILFGKTGALCSLLIRLVNTYGVESSEGHIKITRKLTNTELGDMIGTTRESVNRMLSDLKKDQIISNDKGYLVIENLEYLRSLCFCEKCPKEICRV